MHRKCTDDEDININKNQGVNLNTHQRTMRTRRSRLINSSTTGSPTSTPPATPVRNTAIVNSETESESEIQSDEEHVVENQLGLPEFQHDVIESSPPPVNVNIICNELNNKGEFFLRCLQN